MDDPGMKVGELARRTGLSVRTLHHYDAVGLLRPEARTAAGHRLYGARDMRRLQQIVSLRQLGLSLEEIRSCLDDPAYSLKRVVEIHVAAVRAEIEQQERLCGLLDALLEKLAGGEELSVDELTRTIEETITMEGYYTPEQLERLARHREEVGEDRIKEVEREWKELFAAYERAMSAGVDAASEEVLALARRSEALIGEFTGGDAGIESSLTTMYRTEGPENVMAQHGMSTTPGLWEYMGKATQALRKTRE